jgi:hypothetical protein
MLLSQPPTTRKLSLKFSNYRKTVTVHLSNMHLYVDNKLLDQDSFLLLKGCFNTKYVSLRELFWIS